MRPIGYSELGPCLALTRDGRRCSRTADYSLAVDDRVVPLCGPHARVARMGSVAFWDPDQPPSAPAAAGDRWSEEDDAYVLSSRGGPIARIARHLGRTVPGVQQRQAILLRRKEGSG